MINNYQHCKKSTYQPHKYTYLFHGEIRARMNRLINLSYIQAHWSNIYISRVYLCIEFYFICWGFFLSFFGCAQWHVCDDSIVIVSKRLAYLLVQSIWQSHAENVPNFTAITFWWEISNKTQIEYKQRNRKRSTRLSVSTDIHVHAFANQQL